MAKKKKSNTSKKKTSKPKITVVDFNKELYQEKKVKNIKECLHYNNKKSITWINIDGIHDKKLIEEIGKTFNLHPLLVEDILSYNQPPKHDEFNDYLFLILKKIIYNKSLNIEQISLMLGHNWLITFQENEGEIFNFIKERLNNEKSRIRTMGSDYLAYSLIDVIIDHYFSALEVIGEKVQIIESSIIKGHTEHSLSKIQTLKHEMLLLRKSIWPLREIINTFLRGDSPFFRKDMHVYFRDLYDHIAQIIDTIEIQREMLSGISEIYLSSISNKTNDVMKFLTIIGTIFIPLTFITGLYGMNFKFMPELNWKFGYFGSLGIMIIIAIGMLIYFRKKKWI